MHSCLDISPIQKVSICCRQKLQHFPCISVFTQCYLFFNRSRSGRKEPGVFVPIMPSIHTLLVLWRSKCLLFFHARNVWGPHTKQKCAKGRERSVVGTSFESIKLTTKQNHKLQPLNKNIIIPKPKPSKCTFIFWLCYTMFVPSLSSFGARSGSLKGSKYTKYDQNNKTLEVS